MATAKKGDLFRLRLRRVPKGVEVSVLTEPTLWESFKAAMSNSSSGRSRAHEVHMQTEAGSSYTFIPRAASSLLEADQHLTPFIFQKDPTTLVCPVSRTKDQLVKFAQAARDFVAKWYESRLQPLSVEMSVAVTLAESITTEAETEVAS